jgi:hypothetical protein
MDLEEEEDLIKNERREHASVHIILERNSQNTPSNKYYVDKKQ